MTMTFRSPRSLRRIAAALAAGLGLALVGCGGGDGATGDGQDQAAAQTGIRVVSPDEAATILADSGDAVTVIDVRTPEEYAEGHLDGATLIDIGAADFDERLADLAPDAPYVVYCRSGNRSAQARQAMTDLGFSDVADIDGGIQAWEAAGLPVTTS